VDGFITPNVEICRGCRITVADRDIQVGDQTLQALANTGNGSLGQFLTGDRRNGPGEIDLLLGTVTHNHYLLQRGNVHFQSDIHYRAAVNGYFLWPVTGIGKDEGRVCVLQVQGILSIKIGDRSQCRSFYLDGYPNEWFAFIRYNRPTYLVSIHHG